MATPQQVEANRNNAQKSTGATSQTGKERSSLNAVKHGFTGQQLVLSDSEKEAYEFHVLAYMDEYAPKTQIETNLVQQFADLNWSLHQIAVQQHNLMSLINAMTEQLMKQGDLEAQSKALAQPYRTLNTLGIYESRKRRAANALEAQLTAMLEARALAVKEAAAKIGFVHSAPETKPQPESEPATQPESLRPLPDLCVSA
jgi:hypothetical protein